MSHREFDIKMRRRSSKLNGVSCLAPALHETFYCPIKWILMKAVIAFSNTAHQNWLWQSRGWNPSLLMFSWRSLFSGFCFLTLSQPEPTQQPEPSTHHASFAVRHSQTFSWTLLTDWFWLRLWLKPPPESCGRCRTPIPITSDSSCPPTSHMFGEVGELIIFEMCLCKPC